MSIILLGSGALPANFGSEFFAFSASIGFIVAGKDSTTVTHRIFKSKNGTEWEELSGLPANVSAGDSVLRAAYGSLDVGDIDRIAVLISIAAAPAARELWSMDINGVWTLEPDPPLGALSESNISGPLFYLPGIGFYLFGAISGSLRLWTGTTIDNLDGPFSISLPFGAAGRDGPSIVGIAGHRAASDISLGQVFFRKSSPSDIWINRGTNLSFIQSSNPATNLGAQDIVYDSALSSWIFVRVLTVPVRFQIWKGDTNADNWVLLATVTDAGLSSDTPFLFLFDGKLVVVPDNAGITGALIFTSKANDGVTWVRDETEIGISLIKTGLNSGGIGSSKVVIANIDDFVTLINESGFSVNDFGGGSNVDDVTDLDNTTEPDWDPVLEEGEISLQWTYTKNPAQDPTAFAVMGQKSGGSPVIFTDANSIGNGSRPVLSGANTYNFNITINSETTGLANPSGTWTFWIWVYSLPTLNISPQSNLLGSFNFSSGPTPDIMIPGNGGTGSGGIEFGGAATIVLIADPSGIYTITPGKLHDTLYERSGAITVREVAIPDPFIKTGFLGE